MKKTFILLALLLTFAGNLFCQTTLNQEKDSDDSQNKPKITLVDETGIFRLSPLTDSIIIGTGALLFGTNIVLDKVVHLNQIDYTTYDFDKSRIPNMDLLLMHEYNKPIDYISYGTFALGVITPAIFVTQPKNQWLTIGLMYAETLLWAHSLKETAKNLVIRARPYMYYNLANAPQDELTNYDWGNSFFSGHTTGAFAAASFTSYLFCQYYSESKWKYAVVGTSFALAATTGALRIASGNHYFSDVICGAAIGTLTGFLIPYFHTAPYWKKNKKVEVAVIPNGFMLTAHL